MLTSVAGEPVPVGDTQHRLACRHRGRDFHAQVAIPVPQGGHILVRPRGSCLESKRVVQLLGRAGEPGLGFQYNEPADYARVDPQLCSAYRPRWPGSWILAPRSPRLSDVADVRGCGSHRHEARSVVPHHLLLSPTRRERCVRSGTLLRDHRGTDKTLPLPLEPSQVSAPKDRERHVVCVLRMRNSIAMETRSKHGLPKHVGGAAFRLVCSTGTCYWKNLHL